MPLQKPSEAACPCLVSFAPDAPSRRVTKSGQNADSWTCAKHLVPENEFRLLETIEPDFDQLIMDRFGDDPDWEQDISHQLDAYLGSAEEHRNRTATGGDVAD